MTADEPVTRVELEALLGTRRELGPEYEDALVASFAERVEQALARRADAGAVEVARHAREDEEARKRQFVLGIVSLGVGVSITVVPVVTNGADGLVATLVAWAGVVGVNVAHAFSVRRTDRPR